MRLVSTPDNPIPTGAIVASVRAVDGVRLRTARWVPARAPRGTVVILGGRAEFIEKYFETIQQLLDRGFAVATMDWRGQGGSARQLRNPRKGHIDDFSLYERDLDAFVSEVLEPVVPAAVVRTVPFHGRGDHARRRAGRALPVRSAGADFADDRARRLEAAARRAVGRRGSRRGRPRRRFRAGRRLENRRLRRLSPAMPHTSDPVRYARMSGVVAADPELGLGWPTVGWLHAAFRLMREFEDPDFPRRTLTPILVIASGADRVTDTRAAERFAARLRAGRLIVIDGAEHELMMERDVFRDRFWAAFDAFIPGVEGEKARAAQ